MFLLLKVIFKAEYKAIYIKYNAKKWTRSCLHKVLNY